MANYVELAGYSDAELEGVALKDLQGFYRYCRKIALWGMGQEALDAHIAKFESVSPVEHIRAIKSVRCACSKCGGSGQYAWGGSNNGRARFQGVCFQCEGKGYQTHDDFARNRAHANHSIRRAFVAMTTDGGRNEDSRYEWETN